MAKRFTGIGVLVVLTAVGGFAALAACGTDSDAGTCATLTTCCAQITGTTQGDMSNHSECLAVLGTMDDSSCGTAQADFEGAGVCTVSTSTGTGATGCAGLSACCSSSPDPATCAEFVAEGNDAVCSAEITIYGSACVTVTPVTATGCAGLTACCTSLSGTAQTECDGLVTDSAGSDTNCTTFLTSLQTDGMCAASGTGTGTGTGGSSCSTLSACCGTQGADETSCEEIVTAGVETSCASYVTLFGCGGTGTGTGTGGTSCATLSTCCGTLESEEQAGCDETVTEGNDALCASSVTSYGCGATGTGSGTGTSGGGCSALSTCCATIEEAEQATCNEIVSEGNDSSCSATLTDYEDSSLCN
jgi:hypothetical protein